MIGDPVDAETVWGCIGFLKRRASALNPTWIGDEAPTPEVAVSLWWAGYARAVQELMAAAPFRPGLIPDDLSELDS